MSTSTQEPTALEPLSFALEDAAAVDVEGRTITGTIAAYHVPSSGQRATLGLHALNPRMPLDKIKMLVDHNKGNPVGYMLTYDPGTLRASFKIPEGEAGDKALAEAANGLRDGLSIGIIPTAITPDANGNGYTITAAELYEVSLVAVPDFQDARVQTVTASIAVPNESEPTMSAPIIVTEAPAPAAAAAGPAAGAGVPMGFGITAAPVVSARETFKLEVRDHGIEFALANIVAADVFDNSAAPGWLGEVYTAQNTRQHYAGLVAQDTLTSQKATGWAWVNRPDVYDYAGDLGEVGTGAVDTKEVTVTAEYTASAHKVARIHLDMPNEGFWDSFYRERAQNYDRLIDGKVFAHLNNANNHTAMTTPLASEPFEYMYDAAEAVWDTTGLAPTYYIVSRDLYKSMALTAEHDKLGYLAGSFTIASGNYEGTTIVKAPGGATPMTTGVLAGAGEATKLWQLGGGTVRAEALDIAKGGIDAGLFGYHALLTSDVRAVVKVSKGV